MIRIVGTMCIGFAVLVASGCAPGALKTQRPTPSAPLERQMERQQMRITAMEQQLATLSVAQRERDEQYAEVMARLDAVLAEVSDVRRVSTASRSNTYDGMVMRQPRSDVATAGATEQSIDGDQRTPTEIYRRAFAAYTTGRHAEAQELFEEFVTSFPDNDYVANARFWQGEACLAQGLYAEAKQAFAAVIEFDPQSSKAPFAQLKQGLILARQGETDAARKVLQDVQNDYPGTEAAEQAGTVLNSGRLN